MSQLRNIFTLITLLSTLCYLFLLFVATFAETEFSDVLTVETREAQNGKTQYSLVMYRYPGSVKGYQVIRVKQSETPVRITSVVAVNTFQRVYFGEYNEETKKGRICYFSSIGNQPFTIYEHTSNLDHAPYSLQVHNIYWKLFWTAEDSDKESSSNELVENHFTTIYMTNLLNYSGIRRIILNLIGYNEQATLTIKGFNPNKHLTLDQKIMSENGGDLYFVIDKIQVWRARIGESLLNQTQSFTDTTYRQDAFLFIKNETLSPQEILSMQAYQTKDSIFSRSEWYLAVGGLHYLHWIGTNGTLEFQGPYFNQVSVTGICLDRESNTMPLYVSLLASNNASSSLCRDTGALVCSNDITCARISSLSTGILSKSKDQCLQMCQGNSLCYRDTCVCSKGYSGLYCDQCDNDVACNGRGTCNVASGQCACTSGSGPHCEIDVTCFGKEGNAGCSYHGRCVSQDICRCLDNYSGLQCQFATCHGINSSDTNHVCNAHGICQDHNTCKCVEEWSGDNCQFTTCFAMNSSNIEACHNHGECVGYNQCKCNQGWSGDECQFATCFNKSSSDPEVCSGHGQCTDHDHCDCYFGWKGSKDCSSCDSLCGIHGQCDSIGKDFRCKCQPGFRGDFCESCDSDILCSGHGNCVISSNTSSVSCNCTGDWSGEDCSQRMLIVC